jgi:hypothetical protein
VLERWEVKTLQRLNAALCDYKSEQLRKCSEQAGLIIEVQKKVSQIIAIPGEEQQLTDPS